MLKEHVRIILSSLILMLLLAACSSSQPISTTKKNTSSQAAVSDGSRPMQADDLLYLILISEYRYWAGSPYQFGGSTLQGVDCSSLIQQVYKNTFNITLPRTTEQQAIQGYSINKSTLRVGDLVFFKTGWKSRHVGIYMGQGQFFHASTSKGVIMSELDNPYWRDAYWQSRRVIH